MIRPIRPAIRLVEIASSPSCAAYNAGTKLFQLQGQGTDTDRGSKLLCSLMTCHTTDLCLTACDGFIYSRSEYGYHIKIEICFPTLFVVASAKLVYPRLLEVRYHDYAFLADRSPSSVMHGFRQRVSCFLRATVPSVQLKLQGTRFSKSSRIAFASDTPGISTLIRSLPFLIYLSLCTVAVNTLLQLVDVSLISSLRRITLLCLIGNADTASQIKTGLDVFHPVPVGPNAYSSRIAEDQNEGSQDQDKIPLFFSCSSSLLFSTRRSSSASAAFIMIAHSTRFLCSSHPIS